MQIPILVSTTNIAQGVSDVEQVGKYTRERPPRMYNVFTDDVSLFILTYTNWMSETVTP